MALVLLGAAGLLAVAQATQATVTGTVRGDASGEPLAGAVVTLTDLGRATVTDARGEWVVRVPPVPAKWRVDVKIKGYRPEQRSVSVTGEQRIDLSIILEPARQPQEATQ